MATEVKKVVTFGRQQLGRTRRDFWQAVLCLPRVSTSWRFTEPDAHEQLLPCACRVQCAPVCSVHPGFWPKLSGKKIFHFNFLIELFIYLYLDTYFLYSKEILDLFLNMLWYKKFYVTKNYKTQERVQGILGTTHVQRTSLFFP